MYFVNNFDRESFTLLSEEGGVASQYIHIACDAKQSVEQRKKNVVWFVFVLLLSVTVVELYDEQRASVMTAFDRWMPFVVGISTT